ncbi:hypothetical protein [Rhodohalobacter sp. 8-1]|uniref:hypothetical protein n=1 Tax=Rhodohalobacter sp. 8-1 TaxID=3131972 RepID=UPI0030EC0FB0
MENLKELNSKELIDVDGGVPVLLAWAGYTAAAAIVGYFTVEVVDGVVTGVSSSECGCS